MKGAAAIGSLSRRIPIHANSLLVLLIVFVATLVRSAFGFGEALVAVPLLAFCMPLRVATPLAVLLSICVAGIVVIHDWRKIHFRSALWLVLSTLLGIPVGLFILTSAHPGVAKAGLGILILLFALYSLAGIRPLALQGESRAWLLGCGFVAGVLGGAYGMNGPPLVIYGAMRRWSAQHFRATLQAYFLPASLLGMAGFWSAGLWVPAVTHDFLLALPAMIPAVFLGRAINHRLADGAFLKYVYLGLAGIGGLLLFQAVRGHA